MTKRVQLNIGREELEYRIKHSDLLKYLISNGIEFDPVLKSESNTKRRITTNDFTGDKFIGSVNITKDYNMIEINKLIAHTGKCLDYETDDEFFDDLILYCQENNVNPGKARVKWRPIIHDPLFVTLSAEVKRTTLNYLKNKTMFVVYTPIPLPNGDIFFGSVNLTKDYNMEKINKLIAHTGKCLDYETDDEFFDDLILYCQENNVSPGKAKVKWRPIIHDPLFVTLSAEVKRTGLHNLKKKTNFVVYTPQV